MRRPWANALLLAASVLMGCDSSSGESPGAGSGAAPGSGAFGGVGGAVVAGTGSGGTGLGFGGMAGATAGAGGSAGMPFGGSSGVGGSAGAAGAAADAGMGGTGAGSGGLGGGGSGGVGGSSGVGGAAGSDGTPAYQPCPTDGTPCKILPLGDSITWGIGDEANGGYRGPLFASTVAAGQSITFTGALSNGPQNVSGQPFPRRNEGHSGWGISRVTPYSGGNAGIATQLPDPALSSGSGGIPHIILLHIGTNDAGSFTASQMTDDLTGLLDTLTTLAPDALIVVAQIIPLGYGTNDVIEAYNQAIPGIVAPLVAAGKHVAVLDMFTDFVPSTMLDPDNIHPNGTGYTYMADTWYSAIEALLPQ